MTLTRCSDLSPAAWLVDDERPWQRLVSFGPSCFPAHARLRFLPDPVHPGQSENEAQPPSEAGSEIDQLRSLLGQLALHTRTPDECFFCVWDGWGDLEGPTFVLPHRAYHLFHGRLSDIGSWGATDQGSGQPSTGMNAPAFIWPADHAWCVAKDVDPHWAGIGADQAVIDRLVDGSGLDVVHADPDEDQPSYG